VLKRALSELQLKSSPTFQDFTSFKTPVWSGDQNVTDSRVSFEIRNKPVDLVRLVYEAALFLHNDGFDTLDCFF
jgi:hypothetical protein